MYLFIYYLLIIIYLFFIENYCFPFIFLSLWFFYNFFLLQLHLYFQGELLWSLSATDTLWRLQAVRSWQGTVSMGISSLLEVVQAFALMMRLFVSAKDSFMNFVVADIIIYSYNILFWSSFVKWENFIGNWFFFLPTSLYIPMAEKLTFDKPIMCVVFFLLQFCHWCITVYSLGFVFCVYFLLS